MYKRHFEKSNIKVHLPVFSRICKLHIKMSNIHMYVVPGPASQDAVFKRVCASPGLQCKIKVWMMTFSLSFSLTLCLYMYLLYVNTHAIIQRFLCNLLWKTTFSLFCVWIFAMTQFIILLKLFVRRWDRSCSGAWWVSYQRFQRLAGPFPTVCWPTG
jgi:hypothetical protein